MPPHHAVLGAQRHHAPSHGPSRGTRLHTLASDDGKHLPEDTIPGDRIPCTGRDATASPKKAGDTSRSIYLSTGRVYPLTSTNRRWYKVHMP
ncbi:MAG TPA: hypothetical protein DEF41_12705 [Desulfovibrio sp.]|nr:hypothetical protein [Desulfovibrio sp.]